MQAPRARPAPQRQRHDSTQRQSQSQAAADVADSQAARRAEQQAQRLEVRLGYRRLMERTRAQSAELKQPGCDRLVSVLTEAQDLFARVQNPREAALDSEFLSQVSALGAEQIHKLQTGLRCYDIAEFVLRLRQRLGVPDDDAAVVADGGAQAAGDWAAFGRSALARGVWKTTPTTDVMLGPVELPDAQEAEEARKKAQNEEEGQKEQRKERRKTQRDQHADKVRPDEVDSVGGEQQRQTAERIRVVHQALREKGSLEYWRLVVNPKSFGQTIENIFYTSFLVKDGHATLKNNGGVLFVEISDPPTQEDMQSGIAASKQCVMSIDYPTFLHMHSATLLLALALVGVCVASEAAAGRVPSGALECFQDSGYPFWCYNLTVPLDHWNPARPEQLSISFFVHPARKPELRRGSLLYAVGGPGMVAHVYAKQVMTWTPDRVLDAFDMVFFDQRGIGMSCGLWCPNVTAFWGQESLMWQTHSERNHILRDARSYAAQCKTEMAEVMATGCIVGSQQPMAEQIDTVLPFLTTKQAAEDLFAFTKLIDGPFYFYGHSYGTQFGGTYAAAHASQLSGVILDCAVDLTVNDAKFWTDLQEGLIHSTEILEGWCFRDTDCRRDLCTRWGCRDAFKRVFDKLRHGPATVAFPLPTGEVVERQLFLDTVEGVAMGAMSVPGARASLLRAMAAATHGNWLPLLRQSYWSSWVDVTTLVPPVGNTNGDDSTASYWSIIGADYSYDFTRHGTTDPWAKGESFFSYMSRFSHKPYASISLHDVIIAFMQPARVPRALPPPLRAPGVPVLVITSDMDNAVPFVHSVNIWRHLDDGYLVVRKGGMHTLWGRKFRCVDTAVDRLLFGELTEDDREVTCPVAPGDIVGNYTKLVDLEASAYDCIIDVLKAVDTEIQRTPEIAGWDMTYETAIGCAFGGYISANPQLITMTNCETLRGMPISGEMNWPDNFSFNMTGTASGAWSGSFSYLRTSEGTDINWKSA
eukprot:m51a1_g13946 hypothetical protein (982) ;mRNA; r:899498-903608